MQLAFWEASVIFGGQAGVPEGQSAGRCWERFKAAWGRNGARILQSARDLPTTRLSFADMLQLYDILQHPTIPLQRGTLKVTERDRK